MNERGGVRESPRNAPIRPRSARIRPAVCGDCYPCLAQQACARGAIVRVESGELPMVDPHRCWGCLACREACPFGAIELCARA